MHKDKTMEDSMLMNVKTGTKWMIFLEKHKLSKLTPKAAEHLRKNMRGLCPKVKPWVSTQNT